MSDADVKAEIIRRAKQAVVSYGKIHPTSESNYSLKLSNPKLGNLRIYWMADWRNLRIRCSAPGLGKGVLDLYENTKKTFWRYTERNNEILAALRELMVLDDLADV